MGLLQTLKPAVSRHNLLFIAGLAWTTAGAILAGRGISYLVLHDHDLLLRITGGLLSGGFFYLVLFARISRSHIRRIRGLNIPYPCAFSFFDLRGYLMMALMISGGIMMRKLEVINMVWLSTFYITMAVPLLVSAVRFFWYWATNQDISFHR